MHEGSYDIHLRYFISVVNIKGNINQHACWNYTSFSVAIIGWLWIQEFSKHQQKHSVRINYLYGIYDKEYCIFYYILIVCYTFFI